MNRQTFWTAPPSPPEIESVTVIDFTVFRGPVALTANVGTMIYDGTGDVRWNESGPTPTLDVGMYDTIVQMTDGTVYRTKQTWVERYLLDNGYEPT